MDKETYEFILTQMDGIRYGFVDSYGVTHTRIKLKYFLENYHFQSVEETLKYGVGTCWEQVEVARYFALQKGYHVTTYLIDYDAPGVLAKHTIAVLEDEGKYYWLEHAWKKEMEYRYYDRVEEILEEIKERYPSMYKIIGFDKKNIHVYCYEPPKSGISFDAFLSEVKQKGRKC